MSGEPRITPPELKDRKPMVGSFLMGAYLLISLNVFGRHSNEAFSALRIEDDIPAPPHPQGRRPLHLSDRH